MSNNRSETISYAENLAIIREERTSSVQSVNINSDKNDECIKEPRLELKQDFTDVITKSLKDQEIKLRREFEYQLEKEISYLKDRFDYILQNEQVRTSYMLREAHRERQEKIGALQTQLECKNLAGLMYVLCIERRNSKLEKRRIIKEYTGYIKSLQSILSDGQDLILNLSRGYKTAARVDHEWREKMKKVILQFQKFVGDFTDGGIESVQHLFDLPQLLKIASPTEPNCLEDPCEKDEEEFIHEGPEPEKTWWEMLDDEDRPFVVFGDMAEFKAPERRDVLRNVKAAKTAPRKWKQYAFNEMFMKRDCTHLDDIQNEFPKHVPGGPAWDTQGVQTQEFGNVNFSFNNRRFTSLDVRGNMGSILKMITSNIFSNDNDKSKPKTAILGARDSLEIASSTKLLEKQKEGGRSSLTSDKIVLNIGQKRTSRLEDAIENLDIEKANPPCTMTDKEADGDDEESNTGSKIFIGSLHTDSLQLVQDHVPDRDAKINLERRCPVESCNRDHVDSFISSLPPYMTANPFTHFEQTFEEYEPCSPEQLDILMKRINAKPNLILEADTTEDVLAEWNVEVEGVAVQTSLDNMLPPCTCELPKNISNASSQIKVYKLEDLFPIKEAIDHVKQACLYDDNIQFNRFKVMGEGIPKNNTKHRNMTEFEQRLFDVKNILNEHPSLCSLFQANTSN